MKRSSSWSGLAGTLVVLVVLAACSPAGGSSSRPADADDAVRLVLTQEESFAGIEARNPDLIGQSAWYEVEASNAGWQVQVYIGWGDCPAGCISHHTWVYEVSRAGAVELLSEEGDPFTEAGIRGVVLAGPTCPVVTDPPDPDCADRSVAGAVLVIINGAGQEVARVTSAADGSFAVALAPGSYRLIPQPVEGLMGVAPELEVTVQVGEPGAELAIAYDTGIR